MSRNCILGLLMTLDNIAGQALKTNRCGTDRLQNMRIGRQRTFTNLARDQFWTGGVIPWSFASTSNNACVDEAVHIEDTAGLDKRDVDTVKEAVVQIENRTCIKFNLVSPEKGHPWLFIHRENKAKLKPSDPWNCQIEYARANLAGRDIKGLGDIYWHFGFGGKDDDASPTASIFYGI